MYAVKYEQAAASGLSVTADHPIPEPVDDEALIRVTRAGICSTDLEITRGYVPGYCHVMGHEFVGVVARCSAKPSLVGTRVVGEINCNCAKFTCADAMFQRNHAPGRTVLGIIGKDGAMAQYLTLPVENLHVVPDNVSNQEACFAEPLAAACRVIEQGVLQGAERIAVVGDGKLGLLVAQALAVAAPGKVSLFGRHADKMALVSGLAAREIVTPQTAEAYAGAFDVVVEATGCGGGIRTSLGMTRPLGTLVLKSTVSTVPPGVAGDAPASVRPKVDAMPAWSELANDIVVQEKKLLGSRCGPFDMALDMLANHPEVRRLVNTMVSAVFPLREGMDAMAAAAKKGTLKIQLEC